MFSYANITTTRPCVRSRRCRTCHTVAVARPRRWSYAELITSYERAQARMTQQHPVNSTSSSPLYLSDPAFYRNPKLILQQVQSTVQQVVTVSKQATAEVLEAFDPKQQQPTTSSSAFGSSTSMPDHTLDGQALMSTGSGLLNPAEDRHHPSVSFSQRHDQHDDSVKQPGNAAAHEPHDQHHSSSQHKRPKPLKAVGKQAHRLASVIARDVHSATHDAYHRYGPHLTAAGVHLVGRGTAAAGVDIIGKDNTAKAIGQLGSTNAAAATEELGARGFIKVSKRLGPVGIAKVVAQLGPRGVLNLASHIMSRSADEIRARSARLNPDRTEQLNPEQLNPDKDSMDEVSAELVRRFGARSSSGSSGSNGSNLKEGGKGAAVRPATGPLVALLQLVLAAIAGVLQWISNVLAEGVKLWDRVYGEDRPSSRSGRDEPAPQL